MSPMYYGRQTTGFIDFKVIGVAEAKRKFGKVMEGLPNGRLGEMRWLMREAVKYLREEAPKRTGDLRKAMTYRILEHTPTMTRAGAFVGEDKGSGETPPNRYVRWVLEGRGPIVPIHAKALRFELGPPGSGFIFRRRVGPAKANPFDRRVEQRLSGHPIVVARNIGVRVSRDFS